MTINSLSLAGGRVTASMTMRKDENKRVKESLLIFGRLYSDWPALLSAVSALSGPPDLC